MSEEPSIEGLFLMDSVVVVSDCGLSIEGLFLIDRVLVSDCGLSIYGLFLIDSVLVSYLCVFFGEYAGCLPYCMFWNNPCNHTGT